MSKLNFLIRVIKKYISGVDLFCPYCKGNKVATIGTKKFLLKLVRCTKCNLMFRYPKDDEKTNINYYEKEYYEKVPSEIPKEKTLQQLIDKSFLNSDKDFNEKIQIIKHFKSEGTILDFGCSWGYASWQLKRSGFDVTGFEISKIRAKFGCKNLGLKILDSMTDLRSLPFNSFDVIFANHVLEHLPNLFNLFEIFYNLLKKGGVLMIFVPNCSGVVNERVFNFKKSYCFGEKHCLAFDRTFFETNLPKHGFKVQCTSSPYKIDNLFSKTVNEFDTEYSELFVLAKKNKHYELNS